ncbi:hypothetical protein OKW38_006684 [Paraburkholderia sp. MM5496-R1]|uniref:Uncharacterized protein n=1 Tax=Paraburkholderia tuberum TaxID=157910 RepID=A0A1H1JSX8_9BURK|nr:hypothetical protein [Paraburkholderia sp. Cpub6]MBB5410359.1 hypothetical protein [Paraburkholderia sp. HC6.4b]MBB5452568.1 hypothetical protein [Paraburkholderia sp. Kb1A]MBC8732584.1 hypothetical protein [Paraburkholderia sp. UCT2]SDR53141.1 hypothetical protein SAMN05445850_5626 [Paraburkholderia tuberum]MBB5460339.1 hypothetical protein [Paraburkholderia sp. Cpub6]
MYFLDSDLRGPLADYTYDYRRQRAEKGAPSSDESARAKQSNWAARVLGAVAPRALGKLRTEGRAR